MAVAPAISDRKTLTFTGALPRQGGPQDLAQVKQLRGMLPICAWCKQIRNDAGYWRKLEAHLQEHLDVTFTHGICPACATELLK